MSEINEELKEAYAEALKNDASFNFQEKGKYLQEGRCPECRKNEVFINPDEPWRVKCPRDTNCGWTKTTAELYPEIVDSIIESLKDSSNPKAKADTYMKYKRGFDTDVIGDWYEQETFYDEKANISYPTVRFWLDRDRNCYWERLIGRSKSDGQRQNIRGRKRKLKPSDPDFQDFNGTVVKGMWWSPPDQEIKKGDKIYLVEGIFHAIALHLSGYKVVATLAAGYYPLLEIRQHYGKGIIWVWALDDDPAGHVSMARHRQKLESERELSTMALTGSNTMDWDDFYKLGTLSKDNPIFMNNCLHRGQLGCALISKRKAYIEYLKSQRNHFVFEFHNELYSVKVDLKDKTIHEIEVEGDVLEYTHDYVNPEFIAHAAVKMICPAYPKLLYSERHLLSRELRFYMRVDFPSQRRIQDSLDKTTLKNNKSFHEAMVGFGGGGAFYGNDQDFRFIYQNWFKSKDLKEDVRTVNYMGYDDKFGGYIFKNIGFKEGQVIKVDDKGLINSQSESIKTSLSDIDFTFPGRHQPIQWIGDIQKGFGDNGLIVFAFWFGSFFSEQLRAYLGWFPFLEMVGKPGTGKSSILEFLWKASGRNDVYEGINPAKYSRAGRGKVMTKLSGMPIVLMEGDTDDAKQAFDFNEMKDAFNGRPIRGIGLPTGGSETIEPPFKCGLIAAQNNDLDCDKPMISRFVHQKWSEAHFTEEGYKIVNAFKEMEPEEASQFGYQSLCNEPQIVNYIHKKFKELLPKYRVMAGVKMSRIQEVHALIHACYLAMHYVFGQSVFDYEDNVIEKLRGSAIDRQSRMTDDHSDVVQFWEIYELCNIARKTDPDAYFRDRQIEVETLNHSKDPHVIAIDINEVCAAADKQRYRIALAKELKKLLKNSTEYKFLETSVCRSQITEKTKYCWKFRKPGEKEGGG